MLNLPFRIPTPGEVARLTAADWRARLAGPPEAALPWVAGSAAAGHADAQVTLGQWLLAGRGLPADPVRAFAWFKLAAQGGHGDAANMAGRCYENGWGTRAAARAAAFWYTVAAERGSDWGMYNLATALALGRGIEADRAQALAWLRRAAALGHAKSLNLLGGFHEDGWEVEPDPGQAFDCYRRAAQGGDFRGQFNYARMLALRGRLAEARAWIARVPQTATAAFRQRMLAFLRDAPQPALRALYEEAAAAAGISSRGSRPSA